MKTQAEILHENIAELSEKVDGFADAINTSLETVVDKTESIVVDLNQTYARLNEIDDTIANINTDVKVDVDLEELKEYIPEKTTQLVVEELSSKLDTLINAQKQAAIRESGAVDYYYDLIKDNPEVIAFQNNLSSYETDEEKIEAILELLENLDVEDLIDNIELDPLAIALLEVLNGNSNTFGLKKSARVSPGTDTSDETIAAIFYNLMYAGRDKAVHFANNVNKKNIGDQLAEAYKCLIDEKQKVAIEYTGKVHTALKEMLVAYNKVCNDYYNNYKDSVEDIVTDEKDKKQCCTDLETIANLTVKILCFVACNPLFFKREDLAFGHCVTGENIRQIADLIRNNAVTDATPNGFISDHINTDSSEAVLKANARQFIENQLNNIAYTHIQNGAAKGNTPRPTDSTYIKLASVNLTNPPDSDGKQSKCNPDESVSGFLSKWQGFVRTLHGKIHVAPITINVLNADANERRDINITFYIKKPASGVEKDGLAEGYDAHFDEEGVAKFLDGINFTTNYDGCDHRNTIKNIDPSFKALGKNITMSQSSHTRSFESIYNTLKRKASSGIVKGASNEREELKSFETKIRSIISFYHSWIYEVGYSVDILCYSEDEVLYHDFGADSDTLLTQPENGVFGQYSDIYVNSFKKQILEKIEEQIEKDCNEINDLLNQHDPKYTPRIKADSVKAAINDNFYTVSYSHMVNTQVGNYIYKIKGNKLDGPDFYTNEELTNEKWSEILNSLKDDFEWAYYFFLAPKKKPTSYTEDKYGNKTYILSWTINQKPDIACIQLRETNQHDDSCDLVEILSETASRDSSSFWEDIGTKNTFKSEEYTEFINQIHKSSTKWYESITAPRYKDGIAYYKVNIVPYNHSNGIICNPLAPFASMIADKHVYYHGIYLFNPKKDIDISWRELDKFCGGVKLWIDYTNSLIYEHIHCGGTIEGPYLNGQPLTAEEYEEITGQKLKNAYDDKDRYPTRFSVGPGELVEVKDIEQNVCYTLKVRLPSGTITLPANLGIFSGMAFDMKWKVAAGTDSKKLIEEDGIQYALVDLVKDPNGNFEAGKCVCNMNLELEDPK